MGNIKRILSSILILTISILIGCTKVQKQENVNLDLFDVFRGRDLAIGYLINIRKGDISKANEICDKELVSKNVNLVEGVSKIISFQLDRTIASSEFAYYIFNVIRDSSVEPKSDLESYTIKVNRNGDNYIIGEIKAESQRELYIKNNSLRIIGEKGGKSSLVISLSNIPKDTYLRANEIMLYKERVPNNNFGKVVLGFTGEKVAISTIDEKNSFICIAYIDETLIQEGVGVVSQSTESQSSSLNELQEILEKPVTSKVVAVDLLNNSKIEDFIFSKEDDNLAVNYKNENGINRLNIYKTGDGEKLETNFEEIFNKDIYNIKAQYFDEHKIIFDVYKSDGITDEVTGKYSLNLKTVEMNKL